MNGPILIILLLSSFLISSFFTKYLVKYLTKKGLMDVPNDRSSHKIPTPRGGGLAIIVSVLISLILLKALLPETPLPGILFFAGFILVALTSFLDDKLDLSASIRFTLHAVSAVLVIYETGGFQSFPLPEPLNFTLGMWGYLLAFIWIVAVLNIYNFLDGIDGFAGSQAVLAGIAVAALDFGGVGFYLGLFIAASTLGFLMFNWHPAKIFMGDIGSATLGFIFASLPLYFTGTPINTGIYAVIIFLWFFLSDGAFTIIRRALNGEKIWEAHRTHLYQQMVIYGNSHSRVVIMVMFPAVLLTTFFLILYHYWYNLIIIALILAIVLFVMYWFVVMRFKRKADS